ncbi:MAG: polyprenyl synthetase family protein [Candidatus Saccharimonadales bacterium]
MTDISLKDKLAEINKLVEPVIKDILQKDVEDVNNELAFYQCSVGGKRIRPAMVILSGQVFGADVKDLLRPAASIEILHNSTLIIDDIIDHSETRRDQPTCWNKYGKSIAQCASLTYTASVFGGLSGAKNSSKLIDLYSRALKVIVDGEIKDILFERSGRDDEPYIVKNRYKTVTTDDYFKMINQKTAVLLEASCAAGAICARASDEQVAWMGCFGFNLGMAFQIRDDILDIFGDEKEFGKKIGKDIIEKKMGNFVILSAIEKLIAKDKKVLLGYLEGSKEINDEDVKKVTSLIEKTDAKNIAEETAVSYIKTALNALNKMPQNEFNDTLVEIAEYIVSRKK